MLRYFESPKYRFPTIGIVQDPLFHAKKATITSGGFYISKIIKSLEIVSFVAMWSRDLWCKGLPHFQSWWLDQGRETINTVKTFSGLWHTKLCASRITSWTLQLGDTFNWNRCTQAAEMKIANHVLADNLEQQKHHICWSNTGTNVWSDKKRIR